MREMKDSGVEWIGKIPKSWDVQRVKHAFYRKNEKAMIDNPVVLSLSRSGVKVRDITNNEGQIAESYFNYNPVDIDDLLINPMDLYSGANCSLSKVKGVISPAYINLRYKNGVLPRYFDYYFKLQYWLMAFFAFGKGVSYDNRWTLSAETLMNYPIVVPSCKDQQKIAFYLDSKCTNIDTIIEKQQTVIEKLKEYKQKVITEAVLGVNNGCKFKDSGCFWIGRIPFNWKCGQLKYFASIRAGITLGKKYSNNAELIEMPYLRVANVQGDHVDLEDISTLFVLPEEIEKYKLRKGELLMTEGGDRDKLGRGSVWQGEIEPCLHQNHVFAVRTDDSKLDVFYLDYVTSSDVGRVYFDYTAKKTTNLASTNSTTILEFRFPIPPLNEQRQIVDFLDRKCSAIDTTIFKKQALIEKLTAYKKSLIYDVVTGKKEV